MPVAVDLDELVTVVGYAHLVAGFDNRQLTTLVSTVLDAPYTSRQAKYDLRRLRRKGLIERRPHSNGTVRSSV